MAEYQIARPQQDVRLRNWPAGRTNQLKLAVSRLESAVNDTLGASVAQSARRKVSDQVPFILDLTVSPGFKQVQLDFDPPPGLGGHPNRQLLFYEIQHSAVASFVDPTIIQTPQNHVLVSGLGLGEARFYRARVVSSKNEASIWTDPIAATTAQGQIQLTPISDASPRLGKAIGEWQIVFEENYQPVGGAITLNTHLSLATPTFDVERKVGAATQKTFRGGPAHVQFRWALGLLNSLTGRYDYKTIGERTILSARPGYSDEASTPTTNGRNGIKTPMAFGTFMTPFFRPGEGVGTVRFRLEAAKMPGSEWRGAESERALLTSDPLIFVRQGQVLEVLEEF